MEFIISTNSYTPTIRLGLDFSYYKDLKILFCSNKSCLTSINSSKSTSITTIVKQHLLKHKISLKDKNVKEFLISIEKYSSSSIASLATIEHYKYYFKELEVNKKAYLDLVNNYNSLFTRTSTIYLYLKEYKKKLEIPLFSIKKDYFSSNIKV